MLTDIRAISNPSSPIDDIILWGFSQYENLSLKLVTWGMRKCKTPENSNFLKNDKMVISAKIRIFSRS